MFGWQGKLLRIDLGEGAVKVEELKIEELTDNLGGRALATKIFKDEVNAEVDPLAPENKIILATGPLTGTGACSASLCSVVTKSALTGGITNASIKLYFGAELKAAGYDAIIIEGKAASPTLIVIKDEQVFLLPADFLIDKFTDEADSLFRLSFNDPWVARETRFLHIGIAGQKKVPLASLITDGFPVANSVGIGTVFGSKNLIGIGVRGTKDILLQDTKEFFKTVTKHVLELPKELNGFSQLSSYIVFDNFAEHNVLASNYFTQPFAGEISLSKIQETWQRERGCFSCPIACLKATQKGEFLPEIDAFTALGPLCGIFDMKVISELYTTCTKYGLDAVETGFAISCAMAMKERGLLNNSFPDFGDTETVTKIISKIAKKSIILAEGAFKLCEELKQPDAFLGVKKRSIVFDIRNNHFLGLIYATSNCGSDYLNGFTLAQEIIHENVAEKVKLAQDKIAVLESLGICPYLLKLPLNTFLPLVEAVTGISIEEEKLMKKGEEVYQMERNFNEKVGFDQKTDILPSKFLFSDFEIFLKQYYELRG